MLKLVTKCNKKERNSILQLVEREMLSKSMKETINIVNLKNIILLLVLLLEKINLNLISGNNRVRHLELLWELIEEGMIIIMGVGVCSMQIMSRKIWCIVSIVIESLTRMLPRVIYPFVLIRLKLMEEEGLTRERNTDYYYYHYQLLEYSFYLFISYLFYIYNLRFNIIYFIYI